MQAKFRLLRRAAALLFPPRCAFCGAVLPAFQAANGPLVCRACEKKLPFITGETCLKCGKGKKECNCGKRQMEYERCVAPLYYEGPARSGIWRIKFRKKQAGARTFAFYALETVRREYADIPLDMVTFVPMRGGELRERGFNQSRIFAQALAAGLGLPCRDMLVKTADVKPQRTCSLLQRWGNVFGIFAVASPRSAAGKTILLADDVSTTGATLNECAKMLRLGGARKVVCVTMALVKRK